MDPVTERQIACQSVLSSSRRLAASTARAVADVLTPELEEGRPLPDLVYQQKLWASVLDRRWQTLSAADEACHDARADRHSLVGERDADISLLYRELVDLRTLLRGRFGLEPGRLFIGLRGATSRDPVVILRQADRAVARLRDSTRELPASKIPVQPTARIRWATPVADAAKALHGSVARAGLAVKKLDAARLNRRRALKDFNTVFVQVAGWFEAQYRAIGRDDLAEKVRPSRRHPGLTYHQVKRTAATVAKRQAGAETRSVATRLIAPLRQIFDRRRSA